MEDGRHPEPGVKMHVEELRHYAVGAFRGRGSRRGEAADDGAAEPEPAARPPPLPGPPAANERANNTAEEQREPLQPAP